MSDQISKNSPSGISVKRIPKIYLYPLALLLVLLVLSGLRISGSSVGIYNSVLNGESKNDSSLLVGEPRPIRSDEFLVNSQLVIAQDQNNFERINYDIDGGKDMSIVGDAPYKDWSSIFKPQNFSFFVAPLEHAFAFKWWFLLFSLLLASYFFALKLFKNKIMLAIAFSVVVACNPFVFWWYLSTTIMTLTYGFLILTIGMLLIERKKINLGKHELNAVKSDIILSAALSYVLASFALILYPPFQIPVALVVFAFLVGYFLEKSDWRDVRSDLRTAVPFISAAVAAVGFVGLFVLTRSEAIRAISDSVYPGNQSNPSGNDSVRVLFSTYLQPLLQEGTRGENFISNHSESSRFIIPTQFFIFPLIVTVIVSWLKNRKVQWTLLMMLIVNFLFLGELFLPSFDILSDLFILSRVSHARLQIGLGFLAMISIAAFIRTWLVERPSRRVSIIFAVYSLAYFAIAVNAGFKIREAYPLFVSNGYFIFFSALVLVFGIALVLQRFHFSGLFVLAVLGIVSIAAINPLYVGLGPLNENKVMDAIKEVSDEDSTWGVVLSSSLLENFPQMAGRKAITGVNLYPNVEDWSKFVGSENSFVFNRYAHVNLDTSEVDVQLAATDVFIASVRCDSELATQVDFLLSDMELELQCVEKIKVIEYPAKTAFIYRMNS